MPTVSIKGTTKAFKVNKGEVLYDALCDRGQVLPHGCLAGSCGACRVEVVSGRENLVPPGVVEQNTIEAVREEFVKSYGLDFVKDKEIRLSCRAKVMGNVTIIPIK